MTQAERFKRLMAKHPSAPVELRCILAATLLTAEQQVELWYFLKALAPEVAGK